MPCEMRPRWVVFALLLVCKLVWVHGDPQVPCFFIFGDSLVDNGNNNNFPTFAKSNYAPYGIDYEGPSGRFTNGRTIVDFLAEMIGFNHSIPSYLSSKYSNNNSYILQGLNYASGAAGIQDETGSHLGYRVSFRQQISNHKDIFSRIVNIFRNKQKAQQHLNKCLYYIGMGNNDYINNFYMPQNYPSSKIYSLDQFTDSLIKIYASQIRILYQYYGARKIALAGTGVIGCTPDAISKRGSTGCVDDMNKASEGFNTKLLALVDQLNNELTNAKLIYLNSYGIGQGDPSSLGFKFVASGCCPVREDGQCVPNRSPCLNRREYVFWDSFHPTEGINKLTAGRMYNAFAPDDSHPFDISHLIAPNSTAESG